MIQEKKCKGQGKAASFKGCGKLVNVAYRKQGLCSSCFAEFIMTTEPGKIMLQKALFKVQKPRLDLEKAEKENKQRSKLKLAHERTKQVVHSYVRERDKGKSCISCNTPWKTDFQCGHFYPAGSFETLRYHLDNLNGQCQQCNLYNSGNFENYSLNLPKRIGQERYDALVKLAEIDKQQSKVFDIDALLTIQNEIKKLRK